MNKMNRLRIEYEEVKKTYKGSTIKVAIMPNNNLEHWKGIIDGPEGTVYQGGQFFIDIKMSPEYPFKPPKVTFETKIWHPNISSVTGAICLDILTKSWTPAYSVRTILLSLQALLCTPEPTDPQDAVVAGEYLNLHDEFVKHAKEWVTTYASPTVYKKRVDTIGEMGFAKDKIEEALSLCGFDQEEALNLLISQLS